MIIKNKIIVIIIIIKEKYFNMSPAESFAQTVKRSFGAESKKKKMRKKMMFLFHI